MTIIETSAGQTFAVKPTDLDHVWLGIAVKRVKGEYVAKANAKEMLVRKQGARVVRV
jgi:hypothetical protein